MFDHEMQQSTRLPYMQKATSQNTVQCFKKLSRPELEAISLNEVCLKAHTPINVDMLQKKLVLHPDQTFVQYLIQGLAIGFDTGFKKLPDTSYECKNLVNARLNPKDTSDLVTSELNKGFLLGPFATIPFEKFRINPIGIAESKYSKKKRLIVDLSSPHDNDQHPSLNNLIDKEDFSLSYVTIDEAITTIKRTGVGCCLLKTDISDAFKLIPIHPTLWPFHGIQWEKQFYFYKQLVFGSRSSPKIFDNLSVAVCWIAENSYLIPNIMHLLDDFLSVVPLDQDPHTGMEIFLKVFRDLNIPLSAKKTVGPVTTLEYLGFILDTIRMEVRLPEDKLLRIRSLISSFLHRKSCTKKEILSILGHLNYACKVVHPGRSFVSRIIKLSTTVKENHHYIKLNTDFRSDLAMWSKFLSGWNGVSFFLDEEYTQAADIRLFTDSTDTAFGGIYNNKWFQGYFPNDLYSEDTSMALFELYPIVMACSMWGYTWARKKILLNCDNESTVYIINKGRSKIPSIMKFMRKLTWIAATNNFVLHARHIRGRDNSIADAISRFQMVKFRRLAPQADLEPTPCIPLENLLEL